MGHVVESWDFGVGTKSWTLNMREDIVFQNGRAADAEDLAFSILDDHYGPGGRKSAQSYAVAFQTQTRQIPSKYVLNINFEVPTIALPDMALTINAEHTGLYPSDEILADGWDLMLENPTFSGPYMLTREIPGEQNEYDVFVDWWKKPGPDWEKMIMRNVPEHATRLALIETGAVDVIALTALVLDQAAKISGVRIIEQPATVHMQIGFMNMYPTDFKGYKADWPFFDKRVREAFNIAIDRDLIVEKLYGGRSVRQDAPMLAVGMRGWDDPVVQDMIANPIPFDPERAVQLLKDANFDFDADLKMFMGNTIPSGAPEIGELNEAVMTQWIQNLGIKMTLTPLNARPIIDKFKEKEFVDWHFNGATRNSTEPVITTRARYFKFDVWGYNPAAYADIDALRQPLLATTDEAELSRLSGQLSKLIRDEWLYIPLVTNPLFFGLRSEVVKEWKPTIGAPWPHYFEYIEAADALRK